MSSSWDTVSDCERFWRVLSAESGSVMYDVGANGGYTSEMFSSSFREVYAFEPGPAYEALEARAARIENVVAFSLAISDCEGKVRLRSASDSVGTGQLVTPGLPFWGSTISYSDVDCTTLDALLGVLPAPSHVKVDTEGHEIAVLTGASTVISEVRPVWLLEVHARQYEPLMRALLHDYDVELLRHLAYAPESPEYLDHFYMVARP